MTTVQAQTPSLGPGASEPSDISGPKVHQTCGEEASGFSPKRLTIRVGQGYDVHKLVEGRKLILGGVDIPHATGLLGHSDADALLHAITDALLGAVALGDIGRHFPDTDPRYAGADSRVLLRAAVALLAERGWRPINVDATLIAQRPKLAPHAAAMVANVAADLGIAADCVNIKGKTNEQLGYLGREEAIEAQAVVLVERQA